MRRHLAKKVGEEVMRRRKEEKRWGKEEKEGQ
jgi:hypothetical protein